MALLILFKSCSQACCAGCAHADNTLGVKQACRYSRIRVRDVRLVSVNRPPNIFAGFGEALPFDSLRVIAMRWRNAF